MFFLVNKLCRAAPLKYRMKYKHLKRGKSMGPLSFENLSNKIKDLELC